MHKNSSFLSASEGPEDSQEDGKPGRSSSPSPQTALMKEVTVSFLHDVKGEILHIVNESLDRLLSQASASELVKKIERANRPLLRGGSMDSAAASPGSPHEVQNLQAGSALMFGTTGSYGGYSAATEEIGSIARHHQSGSACHSSAGFVSLPIVQRGSFNDLGGGPEPPVTAELPEVRCSSPVKIDIDVSRHSQSTSICGSPSLTDSGERSKPVFFQEGADSHANSGSHPSQTIVLSEGNPIRTQSNPFFKAIDGVHSFQRLASPGGVSQASYGSKYWQSTHSAPDVRMEPMASSVRSVSRQDSSSSNLEVEPGWRRVLTRGHKSPTRGRRASANTFPSTTTEYSGATRSGDVVQDVGSCCMLEPTSWLLVLWNIWAMMVLVTDLMLTPLVAVVDSSLQEQELVPILEMTSIVTWGSDILITFRKGFISADTGVVELRACAVARHYIRTWFLFDVLLVTVDLLVWILGGLSTRGFVSVMRIVRILRFARVLRTIKMSMQRAGHNHVEFSTISSRLPAWMGVATNIAKRMLAIIMFNHFVACGWYGLGSGEFHDSPEHTGWVDRHNRCEGDTMYCYLTAYHWAMTQFTPSSLSVDATNVTERIYTVCTILIGLLVFSSFVGNMTQALVQLGQKNAAENHQRVVVQRYLNQHKVGTAMAARILGFLKGQMRAQHYLRMPDVEALQRLPQDLLRELQAEVLTPLLTLHPLLRCLWMADNRTFLSALQSLEEKAYLASEEVFCADSKCQGMYFTYFGKFLYTRPDRIWEGSFLVPAKVRACEIALWASWAHRGQLAAGDLGGAVFLLEQKAFQEVALSCSIKEELMIYAVICLQRANAGTDVDDLWGCDEDLKPVVAMSLSRLMVDFEEDTGLPENIQVVANTLASVDSTGTKRMCFTAWVHFARVSRQYRETGACGRMYKRFLVACGGNDSMRRSGSLRNGSVRRGTPRNEPLHQLSSLASFDSAAEGTQTDQTFTTLRSTYTRNSKAQSASSLAAGPSESDGQRRRASNVLSSAGNGEWQFGDVPRQAAGCAGEPGGIARVAARHACQPSE
mmetsp:Transcript_54153/g.128923  ORF Transcript_54153/g.128923 Transcript_54153/m.128923 type:complete len:1049 (+) Transcript_54153:119-3265(+)